MSMLKLPLLTELQQKVGELVCFHNFLSYIFKLFTSASTTVIVLFAREHRHKMSTGSSEDHTVCK
jgi:hypothetical protein